MYNSDDDGTNESLCSYLQLQNQFDNLVKPDRDTRKSSAKSTQPGLA